MRRSALQSHLAQYDGRHTDILERVAVAIAEDPDAACTLVDISAEHPLGHTASAATWVLLWLVKRANAPAIDAATIARLGAVLAKADHWETRLHILQALEHVDLGTILSKSQRESLAKLAMRHTSDARPFVAAWALNLLGRLGDGVSRRTQTQIAGLIEAAETNGPASTKARLRQLRKAGGLEWLDAFHA